MTEMHAHFQQDQQNSIQAGLIRVRIAICLSLFVCFLQVLTELLVYNKLMIHTTVDVRTLELSLPKNSRAELSTVCRKLQLSKRRYLASEIQLCQSMKVIVIPV